MRQLPKEHATGVTIVVKSLSKVYPFIKGWELSEGWDNYKTTLYIELIINIEEASKFYNKPPTGFKNKKGSTLSMFLGMTDIFNNKSEWDDEFEFFYGEKQKMINKLNNVYHMIPEDYIRFREGAYNKEKPIKLDIDYYISDN